MPSFKSDTENNPVILDIGEVYTKVGINGDSEPRSIIPTSITNPDGTEKYILKHDHSSIIGYQPGEDFRRIIYKFLEKIYFGILQVNPKHHSVIICESLVGSRKLRDTLADVLLNDFEVPSLNFSSHHLMACFTIANGTALVLDCSYGETVAIPVVEWTPLLWCWHSADTGSAAIHKSIEKKLLENGKQLVGDKTEEKIDVEISEKILEDIKIKSCFVTTLERSKQIQEKNSELKSPPDFKYYLNGSTTLMIPGSIREESCEVLFEQDNDRISVSTIILDCLLKSPVDTVKQLAKNLVFIGGTSMVPGFKHRVLTELNEAIRSEERYRESLAECEFRLHNPPTHPNLVSWLGASIFGSIKEFRRKFITKEYYEKNNRKLPDWSVSNLPFPDAMEDKQTTPGNLSYIRTLRKSEMFRNRRSKEGN